MRYCIVEELASGGEGHLYLARDMELGNYWAVKELPVSRKKEAKLLRLLEHPYIPRMVDYVETEESCYLVMEYIRGKSLGQLQREEHTFSAEELLAYGDIILQVLEYLHGQKPPVYYGDLKPDNLMLSDSGKLYLVDFGSAVLGFGDMQRICMGTHGFAAPEQYEGKISSASDLFALGKTLKSLAGKNWLKILWKIPGLWLFIYRLTDPKEKRRIQNASKARKILAGLGKRKGQTRKNLAVALGTASILLAGGMFFAKREKSPSFEEALTKVTEAYYELDESKSGQEQIEKGLQELLKDYTEEEQQRKLLLLLAANAEIQREWEKAAVYYEQLLLYAPGYGEGYGKYGLFLLRVGQASSSRRLLRVYEQREISGKEECTSVMLWKEKIKK